MDAKKLPTRSDNVKGLSTSAETERSWRSELKIGFRKIHPPKWLSWLHSRPTSNKRCNLRACVSLLLVWSGKDIRKVCSVSKTTDRAHPQYDAPMEQDSRPTRIRPEASISGFDMRSTERYGNMSHNEFTLARRGARLCALTVNI